MRKVSLAFASLVVVLGNASCSVTPSPRSGASASEPTPSPTAAPTPDAMAPTLVSQQPAAGGELDASGIRVSFSEPVHGVDAASFQLSSEVGVIDSVVSLDPSGRTATLVPQATLPFATTYTVTLTGLVDDLAGNQLVRTNWTVSTTNRVSFAPGTYTGYRFGDSPSHLTALKRSTLGSLSTATGSAWQTIGDAGYLLVDAGIWAGYWVHGERDGTARDDLTASIPALPACDYVDLPANRVGYGQWGTTVLDTVFQLPDGYTPPDLVDTSHAGLNGSYFIRAIAQKDLAAMITAAGTAGAHLAVQSAYRSYAGQVLTFDGWVRQSGYTQALRVSARPGHSEHQLGTAIDFKTVGGIAPWRYADWATSTEGAWLAANAWKFGWLMSYPKGSSALTCYSYEPWHYRYVGRTTAAAVHAAGTTLREWLWAQGYGVR
ncbi:MAG TPA: D-alanyl-D-alanine carboxypeptidase family protein [Methylomirabilota bacterium]|nr:D-alanyl-D-alanine carboxypeptidase family protein [Methylomirabilota bacterium]